MNGLGTSSSSASSSSRGNKFYDVKMGTIAIIMRMPDLGHICGDGVAHTVSLRQRCTHALILFGNVAG